MNVNPLRAAEMRPFPMKEVQKMPEYLDWQHAALLNQLIANIDTDMVNGFYGLEISLTARQVDELAAIAAVFDALARAAGGPPPIQDQGGD